MRGSGAMVERRNPLDQVLGAQPWYLSQNGNGKWQRMMMMVMMISFF